jgi:hypothetical protein
MQEERYAGKGYNNESLLRAASIVGGKEAKEVNRMTKDQEHDEGALMYTYVQVMDAYREGTVDNQIEDSKNGVGRIPDTGYEGMS